MLTTIRGIYQDGVVKPLEYLDVDDKTEVLITILKKDEPVHEPHTSVRGMFKKYADKNLQAKEKDAWKNKMKDKHGIS